MKFLLVTIHPDLTGVWIVKKLIRFQPDSQEVINPLCLIQTRAWLPQIKYRPVHSPVIALIAGEVSVWPSFAIYDRDLTEQEREQAEIYMRAKWFGEIPDGYYADGYVPLLTVLDGGVVDVNGQTRTVGTLSGDGVVSNGTLKVSYLLTVAGSLTVDNIELTTGCTMPVDISEGSADTVNVSGTVTFGTSGTITVNGDSSAGNYDLFVADSVEGAANLDNWQVTGLPQGVSGKLSLNGSTVVLRILAEGTLIILR